jgi:hypothetical protein
MRAFRSKRRWGMTASRCMVAWCSREVVLLVGNICRYSLRSVPRLPRYHVVSSQAMLEVCCRHHVWMVALPRRVFETSYTLLSLVERKAWLPFRSFFDGVLSDSLLAVSQQLLPKSGYKPHPTNLLLPFLLLLPRLPALLTLITSSIRTSWTKSPFTFL